MAHVKKIGKPDCLYLAVTFTNKSTQEMKDRILAYLNDLSNGVQNDLSRSCNKFASASGVKEIRDLNTTRAEGYYQQSV